MATKKDFKKPTAELFLSSAEEPAKEIPKKEEPATPEIVIPKGYRLAPETKSQRLQLLLKPSTKETIKEIAFSKGFSVNELINVILEEYIEKEGEQ